MILRHRLWIAFLLCCCGMTAKAQYSNWRMHTLKIESDTLLLDTLSIVPGSINITFNGAALDTSCFHLDISAAKMWLTPICHVKKGDSVTVSYRVFPLSFSQTYKNRDRNLIKEKYAGQYNPFSYDENANKALQVFNFDGLNKNGSISRGISFGNNQDVIVNSGLNLQLSGTLNDRVEVLAAITDNNIPIQPEGNTQQLQEFDKVFVQLARDSTRLVAGDFELIRPHGYFMNFFKKSQGALFSTSFFADEKNQWLVHTTDAAAISKGKFSRNTFNGTEANQGPYTLIGANNETYIIVLSGSEKIYLDGVLLTRGKDNDYVIDYNTAQITFSARRLITKDSRIVAEFQYSDKNYVRTLLHTANTFEHKNIRLHLNYYSEQDSKNQPLFQDLNAEKKQAMANVGDNIQSAFFENVDSVGFNNNEVLYQKDTVTINGIFYTYYSYSVDSTRAFYRLGFARVGAGNGNYRQVNSVVNGKVFEWIAPVNGVPQGEFEPVQLLIAPKRQQMLTAGADVALSKNTMVMVEGVYSNNNINLFSKKDKGNDAGYGVTASFMNRLPLHLRDTSWHLLSQVAMEYTSAYFKPVENYRPVEFTRDWNLQAQTDTTDEILTTIKAGIEKNPSQNFIYQLKTFNRGSAYKGLINQISTNYVYNNWYLNLNTSLLNTSGQNSKTSFFRNYGDAGRKFKNLKAGYKQENERNKIYLPQTDSLLAASQGYDKGGFYVASSDTGKIQYRAELSRRMDYVTQLQQLKRSTTANQADADFSWQPRYGRKITIGSTYRTLQVNRKEITSQKKDESFLGRAEAALQFLKGGISSNTYYEIGTGQEQKQEYSFIKVAAGTGVFEWNDYNGNGIQELNEFEIAEYNDRAEYIKIYTPTNEFIRTQTNQLSQVLSLNPAAFIKNKEGKTRLINRFALQTSIRFDNKLLAGKISKGLNPFQNTVTDSNLVVTNSSFRSTLFFNRSSSVFAADLNYDNNRNKSLLANGAESRYLHSWLMNTRTYIKRIYGLTMALRMGNKENYSAFAARNYNLQYYELNPNFSIQPGTVFRTTFIYKYQDKQNIYGDADEHATLSTFGAEVKYSSFKNGVVSASFNLISIGYNADANSPVAFEMLESLKRGKNLTWELNIQKNLSGNLQISLGYQGRKPQSERMIHTASVQARAIF